MTGLERRCLRGLVIGCVGLAGSLVASRARAQHLSIDWSKLGGLLRRPEAPIGPAAEGWRTELASRVAPDRAPSDSPLLGGPRGMPGLAGCSLVARDWESATLLVGHMSPTDQVRRSRSRRMVILRERLLEGPIVPFLQLGLGQWRVDPDTPAVPHEVLLAGQFGFGIELALTPWAAMAIEADATLLQPDRPSATSSSSAPVERPSAGEPGASPSVNPPPPQWVHAPASWGSFVALRAAF